MRDLVLVRRRCLCRDRLICYDGILRQGLQLVALPHTQHSSFITYVRASWPAVAVACRSVHAHLVRVYEPSAALARDDESIRV